MDEENEKVNIISESSKPLHTRMARFGTIFINNNGDVYEVDAKDILCGFVAELDRRNLVLSDSIDRHQFLMEMYVTNILSLKFNHPADLIESNDVEDLTENNELFRLMQQYTIYPIWDLYKLSLKEFLDQPCKDIRFQLKMARDLQKLNKANPIVEDEEMIALDETHQISRSQLEAGGPVFKKSF